VGSLRFVRRANCTRNACEALKNKHLGLSKVQRCLRLLGQEVELSQGLDSVEEYTDRAKLSRD
jgi:hypothetical protein